MAVTLYVTKLLLRMGLSVSKSSNQLPYVEARLVNRNGDLAKPWLIEFYCHDAAAGGLKRIQKKVPSKFKSASARNAWAHQVIPQINELLQDGYHRKLEQEQRSSDLQWPNITTALKAVLAIKRQQLRAQSYGNYQTAVERIIQYFSDTKKPDTFDIVDSKFVNEYLEYYQQYYKVSNVTRNNTAIFLSSIFTALVKKGYYVINPFEKIDKLKSDEEGYDLLSADEVQLLMNWIKANDPDLRIYCLLMYYCYIRPKELQLLKVRHFKCDEQRIYIPAEISKNRRSESVTIPDALLPELYQYLSGHDASAYAFGYGGAGTRRADKHHYRRRHEKALRACNVTGPTLYSWKHTGVTNAHMQGVSVIKTMQQCRHQSLDTHYRYLRKLGAIIAEEMNKMKAI